jgi:hypothetical protein
MLSVRIGPELSGSDFAPMLPIKHFTRMNRTLSKALGIFSLGLGLAELTMPGKLAKFLGVEGNERLLQLLGLREIANGIAVLSDTDRVAFLWARVGGDAIDIALLSSALINSRKKGSVAFATASVAAVTALDVLGGVKLQEQEEDITNAIPAEMS